MGQGRLTNPTTTAPTVEAQEVARPILRVGRAEVRERTRARPGSAGKTGERIRAVMTIEQIAARLTALEALGAAVIVASLDNGTSLATVRRSLMGYVVAIEDGKMNARGAAEIKELCETVIEGRAK